MKKRGKIDRTAVERTLLSNERTFMSSIRTALAAFLTGFVILRFFDGTLTDIIAAFSLAFGVIFVITGIISFHRRKRMIIRGDY
jgi:uncharacterized membrane protein YidH (DUF202 family)